MITRHSTTPRKLVLEARAHALRSNLTQSEQVLWQAIRGKRLGIAFRRQVVIDNAIVDFCAPSARLVVEVDGGYHDRRRRADRRRDRALAKAGYRVLRLEAESVLRELPAALARIRGALAPP
jgi:very-short-patch-repair endonuclease